MAGKEASEEFIFEDLGSDRETTSHSVEVDLGHNTDGVTVKPRISHDPGDDDVDGATDFDDLPNRRDEPPTTSRGNDGGGEGDEKRNKFTARLRREQAAKRREREAREAAEAELVKTRRELARLKQGAGSDETKQLDTQIADVEAKLEEALENGKTKDQVRLTSQLTDLKARRIAVEYTRGSADPDDDLDDEPRGANKPPSNPLLRDFLDEHVDWYNQPGFSRWTAKLRQLDKKVYEDGFEPTDPEYYEQLNERIRAEMPEMFDEDGELDPHGARDRLRESKARGDTDKGDKGRRSPVVPADNGGSGGRDRARDPNKVELTEEDFRNMRRFGMDTRDPAVLKEYARNKRQIAMTEGSRG